jgi:Fe-S cluster assembly protein SufD
MPVKTTDPATAAAHLAPLDAVAASLPGLAISWVRALRELGRSRFAALGLPTPRNESWRRTDLKPLLAGGFAAADENAAAAFDVLPSVMPGSPRLVFVDGRLRPALSALGDLPDGVEVASLASLLDTDPEWLGQYLGRSSDIEAHPFAALNTAVLADGAVLRFGAGVEPARPVELVFVSLGREGERTAHHPRTLIVAEPGAKAMVIEHHIGFGDRETFANHVAEIVVGERATLTHIKIQREGAAAFHIANTAVRVERDAHYDSFVLNLGARLARNEIAVTLAGEGASGHLNGAYLVRGKQTSDVTTFIDHAVPNCSSREVYKGVIDGEAHGVFQGKILVRKDAQRTDGHQLNRALLLSDTARIDAKPELEIYADDVKCSHGATAGELDDNQLFYLRARGIPLEEARGLLIAAFLAETLDEVADETVRDALASTVSAWMKGR